MKRRLMNDLLAWKKSPRRKPLVLYGARQVGKTWLLEEFGGAAFANTIRIDFMKNRRAARLFEEDLDPHRIIKDISMIANAPIDPVSTLIIFDEVQEAPRALVSLKYFCEDAREYHIVAAGSYMGIASRPERGAGGEAAEHGTSFPVGKVSTMTLHPLDFDEYLDAIGEGAAVEALLDGDIARVERSIGDRMERRLREYLVTGGMPEAVSAYIADGTLNSARDVQLDILDAYDGDFSKHAPARILERMRLAWGSVPGQLSHEMSKFVYGAVRPGARARDFEESIQWLRDYGVVTKVPRVAALRLPLAGYEDPSAFKLFCLDVGLLGAMAGLDPRTMSEGSRVFTEFKGSLTEQYVCQQLVARGLAPFYWTASNAQAEIDFAIGIADAVVPIEVKAAENLRSRSLKSACERFSISRAVRTSLAGYRDEGKLVNVPLWAAGHIPQLV